GPKWPIVSTATRWPGEGSVTPSPTVATTPANSCPRTTGAIAPVTGCGAEAGMKSGPLCHSSRSVPQMPHQRTWSWTSPGPGGGGGGTSSTRPPPAARQPAASPSPTPGRLRGPDDRHHVAEFAQPGRCDDHLVAGAQREVGRRDDRCAREQHHAHREVECAEEP